MAVSHDPQQLDIEDLSIVSRGYAQQLHNVTRQVDQGVETRSTSLDEENTPLLGNIPQGCYAQLRSKFQSRRHCLWSSKAAVFILVWNFVVSVGLVCFLDPSVYTVISSSIGGLTWPVLLILYGSSAVLLLFYPLAGCLADIRWGRHKTVVNSLCLIFWSPTLVIVLGGLAVVGSIPMWYATNYTLNTTQVISIVVLSLAFGLVGFFGVVFLLCGLVAFSANVIQYGMDQLHNAPSEDSVLYIHWYLWTINMGQLLIRALTISNIDSVVFVFSPLLIPIALCILGVTLCLQRYKRHWFLIEPGSRNPYKLVYKVIKFASNHKNPIRRSAFTYCEDELPSRLDLGKDKYGGPFTTEQVENVKAFLGILRLLLTIGPVFIVDIAINGLLPYLWNYSLLNVETYFYGSGFMTPLITVVSIPLYLCLLRPFIDHYIPGMLKRVGLGMILLLLSGLCTLLMLSFGHSQTKCGLYSESICLINTSLNISQHFLIIQNSLNAVGYMLLYIGTYEFICAQSPHEMKGLLIGTFFAIKGAFQLFGVAAIYTPMAAVCDYSQHKFPICGFVYYLINIVILLIGIFAYLLVARKYQYRQRDEPDNIYRYAEDYYANAQDEPNYDYDDYDNLNVQTIS